MGSWNFILTDRLYQPVGEILNATDRQVAFPLNKLDTASFKVRLDNPLADYLVTTEGYLKGYRNGILKYFGPLISAEETAGPDDASIAVNSVSSGWIFQKRLVGKSASGVQFPSPIEPPGGRTFMGAQIIEIELDSLNTENETGVEAGDMLSGSAVKYTVGPYRTLLDTINELSANFDGFDWRVLPLENFSEGTITGPKIGQLVAQPLIGVERTEAIFEFGTGRNNIESYSRVVSRDTQANKVYHNTSNGPDAPGYPTVSAIDAASISEWKLLEDLAQADLLDIDLRNQLVQQHVQVRAQPRQVITFVPGVANPAAMPDFGVDYDVGDFVTARAVYNGSVRFDVLIRVWGVQFTIDSNGLERATLTLAEE